MKLNFSIQKSRFKINSRIASNSKMNFLTNINEKTSLTNEVFFNTCFDKSNLKSLIAWFLGKYGQKQTIDLVETLKQVGFHQATRAGVSLGIDDLQIPPQKSTLLFQASTRMGNVTNAIEAGTLTSVEKSQRLIDTWNQTSETLRQNAVQNFRTTNPVNPVYMMAFSGARGNISQVRQLVAMRGLMADPQGAILEFPIQSNFREGLTVTEYLISCYGARKGLVDTALRTATSGYLTRRLVDAVQHVVVQVTDCETQKGILIKDKNLEQRLVGRVLLEDISLNSSTIIKKNTLVSHLLAKQIVGKHKQIFVRSPLTCQTEKSVCQLCYGIDLAQGKLVSIGEAVGIIAAQSIGEPGTQLTMRTFHTGGVGVFSDQALKAFNAPFDGKVQFVDSLPGLFVRTPHGNIVYLLKHKTVDKNKPILKLIGTVSQYEIFQNDVPSGSLLWVKQGQIVKSGQLLIQASRLQATTQEMPESSHPVKSPISGEVFFQSMAIRVIEEEKRSLQKIKKKKPQNILSSQFNQKEVSPIFPTLIELGNFWIFSSFIQKEFGLSKFFFLKGDLVSSETPIYQYNLFLPEKGKLQKQKSTVVLGENLFSFLFFRIYYSNLVYFLNLGQTQSKQSLLSFSTNSKEILVTWYPFFTKLSSSGYFSLVHPENSSTLIKIPDTNDLSKTGIVQKTEYQKTRYFWNTLQVFNYKSTRDDILLCALESLGFTPIEFLLITNENTLSKQGFYQIYQNSLLSWSKSFCFEKNHTKNPLTGSNFKPNKTNFLNTSLQKSKSKIFETSGIRFIQENLTWFYIPQKNFHKNFSPQKSQILLEPSKKFERIRFEKHPVSVNLTNRDKILILNSKIKIKNLDSFYVLGDLLTLQKTLGSSNAKIVSVNSSHSLNLTKQQNFTYEKTKSFCFYNKTQKSNVYNLTFKLKRKQTLCQILSCQKSSEQVIPGIKYLKENWLKNKKIILPFSLKSPCFNKQITSKISSTKKPQSCIKLVTPLNSGWFFKTTIVKIQFSLNSIKTSNKVEELKQTIVYKTSQNKLLQTPDFEKVSKLTIPAFNLIFYRNLRFQNLNKFSLYTFRNNSILPEYKISSAFLKPNKLGEYRGYNQKQDKISLSLLRNQDKITYKLPTDFRNKLNSTILVGSQLRWGQELFSGFAIPASGQIVKLTRHNLTLRKGVPLLASVRGLIHISHNEFIQKNDLLITLRSRRLQTEDIVQGIPKIEQLFEARETQGGEIIQNNMHTLLNNFFTRAKQVKPIPEAVQVTLSYIQKYLVDNILDAYSTQGVHIAEKHVEVVVRQMTARVRITEGGDTGLLPGEFIQIRLIEKVNQEVLKLNRRPAEYEPVILGITKSVLQSESFLLAASFQQVSKVLVRSALAKKTDFLRGLHENILVGQAIPAGTGLIDVLDCLEK